MEESNGQQAKKSDDQSAKESVDHKAGFVNIIGSPNVGKSTLMNELVGERMSIITRKAQTTDIEFWELLTMRTIKSFTLILLEFYCLLTRCMKE